MARDVTIHGGFSARNWVPVIAIMAIGMLAIPYALYQLGMNPNAVTTPGEYPATGIMVLFIYSGLSLLAFGGMFRDAAYVRAQRSWKVKWYYFISLPIVIGVGVGALIFTMFGPRLAVLHTLLAFAVSAFGSHSLYMVRRHRNVGVP